ncbi:anaerobic C4-dicarboxylate transporter family protein [Streptomyces sp. NPDC048659]|uniref:anaerobic C4-dicarboxylate transporter family protein n=1 Tax=Streptomyces sp. NPDC048659 TaxID=3155489 RepID=UPI00344014E5
MELWKIILEAAIVLVAIGLGVRTGGMGLGLWGVFGTGLLVFGFGLAPGSPPVSAFFIIIAVISASAAMQSARGIDYLVGIASKIIRRNPERITYVAPFVTFVFTMGSGTSNIFFALMPVIYETSHRSGVRPERPLTASTVASGLGITASPVSAAMAAYLTLLPADFTLAKILAITVPAAIVSIVAVALIQSRVGKDLKDDPEFLRRVEAGIVEPIPARADADAQQRDGQGQALPAGAARSAWLFLAGVAVVVLLGLFDGLRPVVTIGEKTGPLDMSTVIQLVMFTVALLIILLNKLDPADVIKQPLMTAGLVAAIALFGIAWMADTFISGNQTTIIDPLTEMIKDHPYLVAVGFFLVVGLTTSQSTATRTIAPIGLSALSPAVVTAMWTSLTGVWLFPANGSQIAAVELDKTGSTRLSKFPLYHSFTLPMLVSWVVSVGVGLLMATLVS